MCQVLWIQGTQSQHCPTPRAPSLLGEKEVFSKYCVVIFKSESLVWISTGRKVENILGCRLSLGKGLEMGKGRTYLKTARGSSVVESEDRSMRSCRERHCEKICWHENARAPKMTCSEDGLHPKRSQQRKWLSLRKITVGQLSGWIGRDKCGVTRTGQGGGCQRNASDR